MQLGLMSFVQRGVLPAMLPASYASCSPFVNGQARGSGLGTLDDLVGAASREGDGKMSRDCGC